MFIRTYEGDIPDRVYMDAEDVHVSAYLIYVDSEGIACFDEACEYPIDSKKLKNLYIKGVQIVNDEDFYTPISLTKIEDGVELAYISYESDEIVYNTIRTYYKPEPLPPLGLSSLYIADLVFTPPFESGVYTYTVDTSLEAALVTFVPSVEGATVICKLDEQVVVPANPINWLPGENVLTLEVDASGYEESVIYSITVTYTPPKVDPYLTKLEIGDKVLTPPFDSEIFEYAVSTSETTDTLDLEVVPSNVDIVVKLNNDIVTDYTQGITWITGENILDIYLGDETPPIVYKVTTLKNSMGYQGKSQFDGIG